MTILLFVLIPVTVVAAYAVYGWLRTRQPTSVESGVDAFRREMSARSPDAAPSSRRPEPEPEGPDQPVRAPRPDRSADADPSEPRQTPRRPGSPGPEAER